MKRRNNQPSIHLFIILSLLVVTILAGSLVAYAAMTAKDSVVNNFQIGNMQGVVEEEFDSSQPLKLNIPVNKAVRVKNTGTINQFVRVLIQPEIVAEVGTVQKILPAEIGKELLLTLNTSDWQAGEDGYYYYLDALAPGDSTPELLYSVTLADDLTEGYEDAQLTLLIKSETSNCAKYAYRDAWWTGIAPTSGPLQAIDHLLASKAE